MSNPETLQVTTPSDREIRMTRVFDAPRRLVFKAYNEPELLKRWLLGPPGWEMVVCDVALKVGDRYRYEWRNTSGKQFGTGGVCREFAPPERVVCTEMMDGYPSESLVTTVLTEEGGKTTLTTTMLYESKEVRDMVLKTGMERGVAASYDRLAELLPTMEKNTIQS
ncbi:MAG: SRPBCC family protein [Candidatus Acidiferrum sp.]